MATTPTQLPVASEDPRDTKFNAGKIDEFVTSFAQQYIDRFGNSHYTIEGLKRLVLQQIYNLGWSLAGSFQDGATVTSAGDLLQDESTNIWYRWDDLETLPKTVPAGSTPASAGGVGEGKWIPVDISDVLRRELASAADGMGDALIGVKQPVTGSVLRTQHDVNVERISALDFGIKSVGMAGASATDNRELYHVAEAACAEAGAILSFPAGVFEFDNFLGSSHSNFVIEATNGTVFKLTSPTVIPGTSSGVGGFFIYGYDKDLNKVPVSNVKASNITFDCNNIAGENAFGGVSIENSCFYNLKVKNCLFSSTIQGGKAMHFEGGIAKNIALYNTTFLNCSIGAGWQGLPDKSSTAFGINFYGLNMRNVDIPFNPNSTVANPETNSPNTMYMSVYGLSMYNCGSCTGNYSQTATAGGIVASDRGYGLLIDGFNLITDDTYSDIGAFVRGQIFGCTIRNGNIYAKYISAFIDHSPVGFGTPSQFSYPSTTDVKDVNINANLDYLFKGHATNSFGVHSIDVGLNFTKATLAGICDTNSGASTLAFANIRDISTGKSTGMRTFKNILDAGNLVGVARRYDAQGVWIPSDGSGAGLSLTVNAVHQYERNGSLVTFLLDVTYPTTSSSAVAAISGLPFTSIQTGSGAYSGGGVVIMSTAGVSQVGTPQNSKSINFLNSSGSAITNATMSGKRIVVMITYIAGE